MDFSTLVVVFVVFLLFFQGAGVLLDSWNARSSMWAQKGVQTQATQSSVHDFITKISQSGLNKAILRRKGFRERLELLLMRSGYIFQWKPEDLLFYKELCAILGVFLMWQSGQTNIFILAI